MLSRPSTPLDRVGGTLLTPLAAAYHLGITLELLFSYTSHRFRKRNDEGRRLLTQEYNGATWFERAELDGFDQHLRDPWAEPGAARRDPPKAVLDYLHAESGGQCVRCGKGVGVQTAHIEAWATSRSNHHHNLLRICSACHDEHDLHNSLPTEELRRLKQEAIARLRARLKARVAAGTGMSAAPGVDPLFVGRGTELAWLRDALRTEKAVLVRGVAGIGKTELVAQALRSADTGRSLLWVDVERYDSVEALQSCLEIALLDHRAAQGGGNLAARLDALRACVVLDGVEHFQGPALDAIDDWIGELQTKIRATQLVVTSQVGLQRARFSGELSLGGLGDEPVRSLFGALVRPGIVIDPESGEQLVAFADGHPLAARLTALLVNHFGSGRATRDQIERRGVELLELQKRASQDRRTSLRVCLSLAYDALDPDERRLLFLVAGAPGGLFSAAIENGRQGGRHGIENGRPAIAGVQRWHLVRTVEPGEPAERLYMLSPIAAYVDARWRSEAPDEARVLTRELAIDFTLMTAVINSNSEASSDIPYMLARFQQELPNILCVFDLAEREPADAELSSFTAGVCAALMRYFFILRLPDIGTWIMMRGARIASRDGRHKRASDLLVQMLALAQRSGDTTDLALAMSLIDRIEHVAVDSETRGNIALARAIQAKRADDAATQEHQARAAIACFGAARDARMGSSAAEARDRHLAEHESVENDLSSAYGILGDAQLAQGAYADAAAAYRMALTWLRGAAVAVNDGQFLHQIGNCESHLGGHDEAARSYLAAAERFHEIGMREYLGNALCELGLTVLAASDHQLPASPSSTLIDAGLVDVAEDLARHYASPPFDFDACLVCLRKLFGVIVLASLCESADALGAYAVDLRNELIGQAEVSIDQSGLALHHFDMLLALAASITTFEHRARRLGVRDADVEMLANACHHQAPWSYLRHSSFEWLALYLRRRWGCSDVRGRELQAAADRAASGEPFRLQR